MNALTSKPLTFALRLPHSGASPLQAMLHNELHEALRSRWFLVYTVVFGGAVLLLLGLGVTESQVLGFTGISRVLITYLQLCVAVLPIFLLVTTVRAIAGERESGILEYLLALPLTLSSWYWSKLLARFVAVLTPVLGALLLTVAWASLNSISIPWNAVIGIPPLLASLSWCFLGLGMWISCVIRRQEWALGLAFLAWLLLLLFLDVLLIALMLRHQVMEEVIVALTLLNPLQAFRTGVLLLFEPDLSVLGPASYVLLDTLGAVGLQLYAIFYPLLLGSILAVLGLILFRKGDWT